MTKKNWYHSFKASLKIRRSKIFLVGELSNLCDIFPLNSFYFLLFFNLFFLTTGSRMIISSFFRFFLFRFSWNPGKGRPSRASFTRATGGGGRGRGRRGGGVERRRGGGDGGREGEKTRRRWIVKNKKTLVEIDKGSLWIKRHLFTDNQSWPYGVIPDHPI